MRNLHIVMPMAGLGARFVNGGFDIPKPFIKVNGRYMFEKALESIKDISAPKKYTFIVRQEHEKEYSVTKKILDKLPNSDVIVIDHVTRGATETCLRAEKLLDPKDAILIMDCDLYFQSIDFNESIIKILESDQSFYDGWLLSFASQNDRYSYAKIENGRVIQTAEKKVISSNALVGAYFFSTIEIFLNAAKQLLKISRSPTLLEYYISPLYNILLENNKNIGISSSDTYYSFGTPEELESYLSK